MKKLFFISGFALGYVLGSKAGRGRYEQIKSGTENLRVKAQAVAEQPKVQETISKVAEKASDLKDAAGDKLLHREENIEDIPFEASTYEEPDSLGVPKVK